MEKQTENDGILDQFTGRQAEMEEANMAQPTDDVAVETEVISCHLFLVICFIVISIKMNVLWILNNF